MAYIQGEVRGQQALFPATLDELIPADHVCRVVEAFVDKLDSERPFALLKYVIFGHPRFLLRGLAGAPTEISLATLAYNLKTMINALGAAKLTAALA